MSLKLNTFMQSFQNFCKPMKMVVVEGVVVGVVVGVVEGVVVGVVEGVVVYEVEGVVVGGITEGSIVGPAVGISE